MRNRFFSLGILSLAALVAFPGCTGMKWYQSGEYFQMTLDEDFDPMTIRTVGIYVFSEGEPESAVRTTAWSNVDGLDYLDQLFFWPLLFFSAGGVGPRKLTDDSYEFSQNHYPPRVESDATFYPDTSNSGPSLELGMAIKKELEERGYRAEVYTDLGHAGDVSVQQCLEHAREHKKDAAFITCYRGINKWRRLQGTETKSGATILQYERWEGFLYLPNSAFFLTEREEMVWSNAYYGVVQNAHIVNLADERLVKVIPEAIIEKGGSTYFEAAEPAIGMIFEPEYWPGSHKPFPSRREKGSGVQF